MLQLILKRLLLDGQLGGRLEMLHRATTAHTKVRTGWCYALRTAAQDTDEFGAIEPGLSLNDASHYLLARKGTLHENNLALMASNALPFKIH
jgi:hypothetical protein